MRHFIDSTSPSPIGMDTHMNVHFANCALPRAVKQRAAWVPIASSAAAPAPPWETSHSSSGNRRFGWPPASSTSTRASANERRSSSESSSHMLGRATVEIMEGEGAAADGVPPRASAAVLPDRISARSRPKSAVARSGSVPRGRRAPAGSMHAPKLGTAWQQPCLGRCACDARRRPGSHHHADVSGVGVQPSGDSTTRGVSCLLYTSPSPRDS